MNLARQKDPAHQLEDSEPIGMQLTSPSFNPRRTYGDSAERSTVPPLLDDGGYETRQSVGLGEVNMYRIALEREHQDETNEGF